MKKRVVVDVDAGTDDAVALLLLLTLEVEKGIQVVGITCTHGNTTINNVCKNVWTTLHYIGREDIPVFRGAEGPLLPMQGASERYHGENGFADLNFSTPKIIIQSENAVVALNRLASENEGITLICLGPLTNVALALKTYPEFSKNLKEIHLMGGNIKGVGNSSSAAEFNFLNDPEAAHIVLTSVSCPVTVLPWETCSESSLTKEYRFSDIGDYFTPHMKLLNMIELEVYKKEKVWTACDAILMATFLDPKMIRKSRVLHMTVELHGLHTRGQSVVDHSCKKQPNVTVIEEVDLDIYKDLLVKMASYKATD